MSKRKLYSVYMEGYAATGDSGVAQYVGSAKATSFKEACKIVMEDYPEADKFYDEETNSYWGCRLFDNMHDACRSFG